MTASDTAHQEIPALYTTDEGDLTAPTNTLLPVAQFPGTANHWLRYSNAPSPPNGYIKHVMRSARMPKLSRAKINYHHICGTTTDTSSTVEVIKILTIEFN